MIRFQGMIIEYEIRFQQNNKISRHHKKLGVPWTDPTFPANDSSIGLQKVKNTISDLDMLHSINASSGDDDDDDCNRCFFQAQEVRGMEWLRVSCLSKLKSFRFDEMPAFIFHQNVSHIGQDQVQV